MSFYLQVYLYSPAFVYSYFNHTGIALIQLMAYISSCCNPITYCFMNRRFRAAFLAIVNSYKCRYVNFAFNYVKKQLIRGKYFAFYWSTLVWRSFCYTSEFLKIYRVLFCMKLKNSIFFIASAPAIHHQIPTVHRLKCTV